MKDEKTSSNIAPQKKCIFHLPMAIDYSRASASQIRPQKMIAAFQSIGYDVEIIMGRAEERRRISRGLLKKIDAGVRYDFVYSESSTMPTMLTELNHFPISRDIDFGFFEKCRERGLAVGLFYRDVYWRFPEYKKLGRVKSAIGIHYYKRDLKEYLKTLDVLFMPCKAAFAVVEEDIPTLKQVELPPGCDVNTDVIEQRLRKLDQYHTAPLNEINLIYVGGVGAHYQLNTLLESLKIVDALKVTLCVRESDWSTFAEAQEFYNLNNVRVAYVSGEKLEDEYKTADIALMYFDQDLYRSIAIPFKTFEYIAHGLPIITNKNTAASDFIQKNDIGWSIEENSASFTDLIMELRRHPDKIAQLSKRCIDVAHNNTWTQRAAFVAELLSS